MLPRMYSGRCPKRSGRSTILVVQLREVCILCNVVIHITDRQKSEQTSEQSLIVIVAMLACKGGRLNILTGKGECGH